MATTIATSPAAAQINCFSKNAYGDPNRSRAITADAENTITSPTNTSSMVTVNSQRSTLTRFAMGSSFHHGGTEARRRNCRLLIPDCCLSWFQALCRPERSHTLRQPPHSLLKHLPALLIILKLIKARASRGQ